MARANVLSIWVHRRSRERGAVPNVHAGSCRRHLRSSVCTMVVLHVPDIFAKWFGSPQQRSRERGAVPMCAQAAAGASPAVSFGTHNNLTIGSHSEQTARNMSYRRSRERGAVPTCTQAAAGASRPSAVSTGTAPRAAACRVALTLRAG